MMRFVGLGLFLLALVGGVVALTGVQKLYGELPEEERVRGESSAEPQTVSLKDYLATGAGGNRHVRLTRILWCKEYTTVAAPGGGRPVYCVPVIPEEDIIAGNREPQPPSVPMVVQFVNADADIAAVRFKTEVVGLIGGFEDLPKVDRDKLLAAYPQTDPKTCLVLRVGARPMTDAELDALYAEGRNTLLIGSGVGGAAAVTLLVGWLIRRRRRSVG